MRRDSQEPSGSHWRRRSAPQALPRQLLCQSPPGPDPAPCPHLGPCHSTWASRALGTAAWPWVCSQEGPLPELRPHGTPPSLLSTDPSSPGRSRPTLITGRDRRPFQSTRYRAHTEITEICLWFLFVQTWDRSHRSYQHIHTHVTKPFSDKPGLWGPPYSGQATTVPPLLEP